MGCNPWGHQESDTIKQRGTAQHICHGTGLSWVQQEPQTEHSQNEFTVFLSSPFDSTTKGAVKLEMHVLTNFTPGPADATLLSLKGAFLIA